MKLFTSQFMRIGLRWTHTLSMLYLVMANPKYLNTDGMTVYNVFNNAGEVVATKLISDVEGIPEYLKGVRLEKAE